MTKIIKNNVHSNHINKHDPPRLPYTTG